MGRQAHRGWCSLPLVAVTKKLDSWLWQESSLVRTPSPLWAFIWSFKRGQNRDTKSIYQEGMSILGLHSPLASTGMHPNLIPARVRNQVFSLQIPARTRGSRKKRAGQPCLQRRRNERPRTRHIEIRHWPDCEQELFIFLIIHLSRKARRTTWSTPSENNMFNLHLHSRTTPNDFM